MDEPARPPGLTPVSPEPRPVPDALWYKDAVIYEVHVRAFYDSDDDGIGDFAGLTRKLDYIHSLGVNTIWLLPFYPSPQKDDGYDISDYHGIHPSYGTLADFRNFVREAHRRGLRVITELVLNHTSDQHAWFQAARSAPTGSSKRSFYVWSDTTERFADARIIFTDTEKSNWTWDPVAKAYYWHRFFSHQPDLNFGNPRVVKAMARVMRYWLDQGVDGLRLDAIPYLCERDGTSCENLRETHEIIRQLRAQVDAHHPDRMLLAEANQWPEDVRDYFGDGDECHMAYHFPLMPRMYMAIAQEDRHPLVDILDQTPEIPASCQWAIFLRNHDELTLEMVTDRERDYMFQMFAADPKARINIGIRRRLAPLMENDTNRIKLINSLLLSMPGSPIIYFGDEIGMGDNFFLGDRNGVRTPMQWTPDRNAGFSRADPQRLFLPPIMDPVYGYEAVNVEAQERDRSSLLHWTRRMLRVRSGYRAFGRGTLQLLRPGNRKILAYLRQYGDEILLCVSNLGRHAQAVELNLGEFKGFVPVEITGEVSFPPIGDGPYMLTLPGHAFYWFRLARDAESPPWHMDQLPREDLPALVLFDGWNSFFPERVVPWRVSMAERLREQLERDVLPGYLVARRWAPETGGHRVPRAVLLDSAEWSSATDRWLFAIVEVDAGDGRDPARYQLPLSLAWEEDGARETQVTPLALARVREHARVGLMLDALLDERCVRDVVAAIGRAEELPCARGRVRFVPTSAFTRLRGDADAVLSAIAAPVQGSNTAITLGNRLFLKAYRRLAPGPNPEFEIGRFLTETVPFEHVAALAGAIEYVDEAQRVQTLAVLQQYRQNQGKAWDYTLDYLARFLDDLRTGVEVDDGQAHGAYLALVGTLGTRTAGLHVALATRTGDPAFDPRPIDDSDPSRWRERLRHESVTTLAEVERQRDAWPAAAAPLAEALLQQPQDLRVVADLVPARLVGMKTRHHGNYDLGQVLVVHNDFAIVDFEAEHRTDPPEPFDSPLRDVAGMLRSIAYVGGHALDRATGRRPDDRGMLERATASWIALARRRFLECYATAWRASGLGPAPDDAGALLHVFEIEKNLSDVRSQLGRRPEMLHITLRCLLELLRRPGGDSGLWHPQVDRPRIIS